MPARRGGGREAGLGRATGAAASFNMPLGMAISPDGTLVFVADFDNHRIRQIVIATGAVTTLAGSGDSAFMDGTASAASFYDPKGLAASPDGTLLFVADSNSNRIRQVKA